MRTPSVFTKSTQRPRVIKATAPSHSPRSYDVCRTKHHSCPTSVNISPLLQVPVPCPTRILMQSSCSTPSSQMSSPSPSSDISPKQNKLKSVSFYPAVDVVTVPSTEDYENAQIVDSLWWTRSDLRGIHLFVAKELREFMRRRNVADKSKALKLYMKELVTELSALEEEDSLSDASSME
mmetsp:Transcript_28381/g.47695  ORF Transcript_28381/g.47695 Transcript_28381/m.47695 type:complete len:179 (-) Transcript_28381:364-900(-)|eukprot:CAMPEP_0174975828 /NCGR_PEP_ID=MMETSP0004_2-20121128/12666_1 /TAXON_ID=420556 /ORGANISM="Ochromonas sp., Strain CCMP1393" /LENGTH=178 /DNA_ID=CAMNT_0016226735 /DNA_START=87 /DNA_END=623 /DNA_ORIENTATION=+